MRVYFDLSQRGGNLKIGRFFGSSAPIPPFTPAPNVFTYFFTYVQSTFIILNLLMIGPLLYDRRYDGPCWMKV